MEKNYAIVDDSLKVPTYVTLHGLRHTNASLLVKSGKLDIDTITENLGHSKTSTTINIYVRSDNETKKETANILEETLIDKQAQIQKKVTKSHLKSK
ncbi:MAG: tyrosine-type recombinase/integrase [Clostridiales bacterium]|nr:tyrosine-type recombinase/integrase [Clostridiales bacterium]